MRLVDHPDDPAVARDVAVLGAERLAARAHRQGLCEHELAVVGMDDGGEEIRVGLPFLGRVAEHRPDLGADEDVWLPEVERTDERDERQLLDERAVALLGLGEPRLAQLQRFLRELALGDVLHLVDEVERPVALVVGPDKREFWCTHTGWPSECTYRFSCSNEVISPARARATCAQPASRSSGCVSCCSVSSSSCPAS